MSAPVLSLEQFSYGYRPEGAWTLREISFEVHPGQCHCVSGPTGCGKTTLLMAIRGLLPHGRQAGRCFTADTMTGAGIVLQDPAVQLLGMDLGAEVAFGLENHCVPPQAMPESVRAALKKVGLHRPKDTPISALSMGQKYRTCLAGVLVMGPELVLMDEPLSQLDPSGLAELKSAIEDLKSDGKAILICDHRPDLLNPVVDLHWRMDRRGRLTAMDGTLSPPGAGGSAQAVAPAGISSPARTGPHGTTARWESAAGGTGRQTVLRLQEVALHPSAGSAGQSAVSFQLSRGERAVVCGPNGSGKTTLVRCMAGLLRPCGGTIEVFGDLPKCGDLRGRLGVLFQDSGAQLFETTVFDEVAFAAKRYGPAPFDKARVHRLLELLDLNSLAMVPPHQLSYGQKRLVGLAAVAAGEPEMLILDDPLAGLDERYTQKVIELLTHLNQARGTTILCTSHRLDFPCDWAEHELHLEAPAAAIGADGGEDDAESVGRRSGRIAVTAGMALTTGMVLSMAAFAARTTPMLVALTGINLLLLLLWCPDPGKVLTRSAKLFIWQSLIIAALYSLRFGWSDGLFPGMRVAWQLFNALWPGIIISAAVSFSRSSQALSCILPDTAAFVVATCLRFLPMLLREMSTIRQTQLFRGARLMASDLKSPRNWTDWISCLMVPTLVRTLSLSADISTAAAARDFGLYHRRTHWPEDDRS